MTQKVIKERPKRLKLPGLFWDNENWVRAETYPNYLIFTDVCLAETLNVSPVRVGVWREKNVIPYTMAGNFPVYKLCEVLNSLQAHGYEIDENLKSQEDER